jgi:hypothetical protein
MKESEVLRCQIQEWYPKFRTRSIRTRFVQLPEEFVSYLLEDGLFLPEDSDAMPRRTQVRVPQLEADGYSEWEVEEEDGPDAPPVPTFPALAAEVEAAIEGLGGAVLPKLNWSAPKDTAWIATTGSMKCRSFGEVALLLKASDNVVHDLCNAFDSCEDKSMERPAQVVLALRKWYDVRPEMEFRGFVRGNALLGVCQREVTGFYEPLLGREDELSDLVLDFFLDNLKDEFGGGDYTFDVNITKENKVKLIDFNTWRGSTLPLLFGWEELEAKLSEAEAQGTALHPHVDFRIVTSAGLVQLGLRAGTGVPIDFVNQGAWEDIIKSEAEREAREAERGRAGA